MTGVTLPDVAVEKAEGVFDGLTEGEAEVLRRKAVGQSTADIALDLDCSRSSVKSATSRIVKKKAMPIERVIYLVGVRDALAHARATMGDTVHVVVTRGSTVRAIEV